MTKQNKPALVQHTADLLSQSITDAAERAFAAQTVDNSPVLDPDLFRDTVETVSGLNLGNLAREFSSLCNESPLLAAATYNRQLNITNEGYLMAVAFETGRRYNMLQVFSLLGEEVNALAETPDETRKTVLLEN